MQIGGRSLQPHDFVLLDGVRGLGAMIVVIGHTPPLWGIGQFNGGAVIVDMFFLLSGFVIAYTCEPRFSAGMTAGQFIIHRLVRLYPLFLLSIVLGLVVHLAMTIGDQDAAERSWLIMLQFIPELFMLPAPEAISKGAYPLNLPAWTLFFELLVNIVYAVTFRWLSMRVLIVVTAACALGLIATVFTLGEIDAGWSWRTFWGGFARAGFGFFAGVLVYRMVGSPRSAESPATGWSFALIAVSLPIVLMPATRELRPYLDILLVVVMGMPMLWLAQSMAPPRRYAPIFLLGGRISYALYILHQPFRDVVTRLEWRYPALHEVAPLGGIAFLVSMVVVAYLAEKYYDAPLRRWTNARLKRERAAKAPARRAAPAGTAAE